MIFSELDSANLRRAVELAHSSIGLSEPNPRVGCVLHDAQGRLVGEGSTQQAGGPHAEVMALRAARAAGADLAGGTAWVSLEPCAHHGRTPPCCDALISAGLSRVVVALVDPFPQVSGQGVARLREAGMAVDIAPPGVERDAARELNIGFLSRIVRKRPWVRLKVAASLDGRTALPNGLSQWITGPDARQDGHLWRKRAGAILTGIGTVRDDDPQLNVRGVMTHVQPRRVVVDSHLSISDSAKLLEPTAPTTLVCADAEASRIQSLRQRGVTVESIPSLDGRVDLTRLMTYLAESGVNELHVEAGASLNAALLQANLVDELLIYLAPKLLGPGRNMFDLSELTRLDQAAEFRFTDATMIGRDLRILARPPGREDFLPN